LLSAAMGVRAVVRKRRTLLMLDNIRIHLDEVDRLGAFVEFEAVLDATQDPHANTERVRSLVAALELPPDDAITTSYGDLIEALDR
jgi:predicted adenylyl cyclase CyaB